MLEIVQKCINEDRILYTSHARYEMVAEEFGKIYDNEITEAVMNGEIIEIYEDDTPYPSYLLYGETDRSRPIHVVFAYNKDEDMIIIITTYQPTKEKWVGYKVRRKQ